MQGAHGRDVIATGLPSLPSLQLFVAVARHSSISLGALRCGLTQSAASRRLTQLELDLGRPLLERHRRGARLTAEGRAYLAEVEPALQAISAATARLQKRESATPLRLRVYATLAIKWLIPRLPDFQARHPDIRVRLDTAVAPVLFERDGLDLAIQFGEGRWPGTHAELLLVDEIQPICTPQFAEQFGLDAGRHDLAGVRLLASRYRRADWTDWARHADVDLTGAGEQEFPGSLLAYQAAIEGMGLMMGQTRLLAAELASGVLISPYHRPLRRDAGYYLVSPESAREPRKTRLFRRWLREQIDSEPGAHRRLHAAT